MNFLEIMKNRYVQLVACFAVGITVGAVFYPQSSIEERYKEKYQLLETELKSTHSKEMAEVTEKLTQEQQSHKEFKEETSHKIEKLVTENSTLKQSMKKRKFKIVKPDGTIIEKEFEESNSESSQSTVTEIRDEFNRKIASIEDKWKKIHEERVTSLKKEFDEQLAKARSEQKVVEKEKIVEVNKKHLRVEGGYTTENDYYAHSSYTLWGPVFLGGGISGTQHHFGDARVGVGIEF